MLPARREEQGSGPEGGGGFSEQLGSQCGLSRSGGRVRGEEARRSPEVIESLSTGLIKAHRRF